MGGPLNVPGWKHEERITDSIQASEQFKSNGQILPVCVADVAEEGLQQQSKFTVQQNAEVVVMERGPTPCHAQSTLNNTTTNTTSIIPEQHSNNCRKTLNKHISSCQMETKQNERPTRGHPLTRGGLHWCVHLIPVQIVVIRLTVATGTERLIEGTAPCQINPERQIKTRGYETPNPKNCTQVSTGCVISKCLLIQIIRYLLTITS